MSERSDEKAQTVDPLLFGDYAINGGRGRWTAECYRCRYDSGAKHYPGYAEMAVRQHIKDAHHITTSRQDARQTWLRPTIDVPLRSGSAGEPS